MLIGKGRPFSRRAGLFFLVAITVARIVRVTRAFQMKIVALNTNRVLRQRGRRERDIIFKRRLPTRDHGVIVRQDVVLGSGPAVAEAVAVAEIDVAVGRDRAVETLR